MFTKSTWYSPRIQQSATVTRWGHMGQPVLVFPTAGGDAEEIERMHLVRVLNPLIEAGRIKKGDRVGLLGIGSGLNCSMAEIVW